MWNKSWRRSKNPGKQRQYILNAPLHIKQKKIRANLSKELRKKYGKGTCGLRKDDTVKIVRGQFKGKTGKIVKVDLNKLKVHVEGIENIRKEGTKSYYPIEPSNLLITELHMEDKKRKTTLERGKKTVTAEKEEKPKVEKKEDKKEQKNG